MSKYCTHDRSKNVRSLQLLSRLNFIKMHTTVYYSNVLLDYMVKRNHFDFGWDGLHSTSFYWQHTGKNKRISRAREVKKKNPARLNCNFKRLLFFFFCIQLQGQTESFRFSTRRITFDVTLFTTHTGKKSKNKARRPYFSNLVFF